MSREIADHLRYYQELGVAGISRDPAWRRREERGGLSPIAASVPPGGDGDALKGRSSPAATEVASGVLALLKDEIGPACTRCKLHGLGRKQVVFGVGNPNADLMFVGEGPGADEDEQGEPFVGRAGQLLTKIIEAIGLKREDVYIANVIKCRPPGNRNPEADEVESCQPFLFRQIAAIRPKVIVALGKFAAQSLLQTTDPITRLRGREFKYRGATLIATFHPAYLLRNPSSKREVWEDMKKVRAILTGNA
jgi:uracil-DNA glycosylase